jgi:hypothetical protein
MYCSGALPVGAYLTPLRSSALFGVPPSFFLVGGGRIVARECEHCGVVSTEGAEACDLCGPPLPRGAGVEAYPHRIPTGVGVDRSGVPVASLPAASVPVAPVAPTPGPLAAAPVIPTRADDDEVRAPILRPVPFEEPLDDDEVTEEPDFPSIPDTDLTSPAAPADPLDYSTIVADEPADQDRVGERAAEAAAAASYTGDHRTPSGQTPAVGAEPLRGRVMLRVEQGQIIGERYLLTEASTIIGRADPETAHYPDIDLSGQDNDYVHRHHARLTFYDVDTRLSVEHIGGHNLTLVNNEPVEEGELVELCVGDRLRVGRVVMRLQRAPR